MKIIFHKADLDGRCSAAIVRKYEGERATLLGVDHGEPFPWAALSEGELVYLLDFSLPPKDMLRLWKKVNLVWIDHHKSAIEWAESTDFWPPGLRDPDVAACELCWKWLFVGPPPLAVRLLGRYDVWDVDDTVLAFQYALQQYDTSPNGEVWSRLLEPARRDVEALVREGRPILRWLRSYWREYSALYGWRAEWDGRSVWVVNVGKADSLLAEASPTADIYAFVARRKGKWRVSLRSDIVDVGKLALTRGGGGHKSAAGFTCEKFPWKEVNDENS